jgi:hypothetical protein
MNGISLSPKPVEINFIRLLDDGLLMGHADNERRSMATSTPTMPRGQAIDLP